MDVFINFLLGGQLVELQCCSGSLSIITVYYYDDDYCYYRLTLTTQTGIEKLTVNDVNTSLPVIPGAGKTRSRDDDVIVSVTVDVTAHQVPAYDVIQRQDSLCSYSILLLKNLT